MTRFNRRSHDFVAGDLSTISNLIGRSRNAWMVSTCLKRKVHIKYIGHPEYNYSVAAWFVMYAWMYT